MSVTNLNRVIIAGTSSGCGKTTITCAIIKALVNRNIVVQPYKCGPDYIDTMFHTHISKRISRNLDTFMLDRQTIEYLISKNSKGVDISIIEGVMGYYDGVGADGDYSTYTLSALTKTPTILIIDAKSIATSVAAIAKGFVDFKSNSNIKGIILNGVKSSYYNIQKEAIENNTNLKVLGYMPILECSKIESRHLGLTTANEIDDLDAKLNSLAKQLEQTVDLDLLLQIAKQAEQLDLSDFKCLKKITNFKIAVAKDKAFCFYYQDNIDLLEQLGAEIIEFSPLNDKKLPDNIDGLYLGGGYPEIYADILEKNYSMRASIYNNVKNGLPTIAECGGFMYLCNKIINLDGKSYNMVGILDGEVSMTNKLVRFGYVRLKSLTNNLLGKQNSSIKAHEFHYSDSTINGDSYEIAKLSGIKWLGINATKNLYAGYPHIHFWSNIDYAINFCKNIKDYKKNLHSD